MSKIGTAQRITQHKRFVPYSAYPNFCLAKTSFMLKTLSAQCGQGRPFLKNYLCYEELIKWRLLIE
ncbi:MAG: hypothetical protein FD151_242 [bacterium]|nr:MAG: hypothetical protein FD151_242 [bacterium]